MPSNPMRSVPMQSLLADAERLIRTRGYQAFHLSDLGSSASLAEFRTKEALCTTLIRQHIAHIKTELYDIKLEYRDAESRLIAYACLFSEGFEKGLAPLSSVLAAARSSVPNALRKEIVKLFRMQLNWIQEVIREHGESRGQTTPLPPEHAARLLLSTLEGDAVIECALSADEPSAASFSQVLVTLGIKGH
ncbi:hypothetical protein ACV229_29475 [Burkholderia sp. MR1-5-21]